MTSNRVHTNFLSGVLLASVGLLAACESAEKGISGGVVESRPAQQTYSGRVSSAGGTQGSFMTMTSLDSAAMLEVWSVSDDGTQTLMGEGVIAADGSFSVDVRTEGAEEDSFAVLHAVDVQGDIVASAVVESLGSEGDAALTQRLDVETTVETWVWLERVREEGDAAAAGYADLRTRIDAELAATVYALGASSAEAQEASIAALSAAAEAAVDARVMAYQASGWDGDSADLYGVMVEASQSLDATIRATQDGDSAGYQEAYAAFFAELSAALAAEGMDAEDRYDAEAAASLAFRMALDARLSGESVAEESGERASALLEASALLDFLAERADEGDMDPESAALLLDAAAELVVTLQGATSSEAAEDAWEAYKASAMVAVDAMLSAVTSADGGTGTGGSAEGESLLEDLLGLEWDGSDSEDMIETLLDINLEAALDAALQGELDAVFSDLEADFDRAEDGAEAAEAALSFFAALDASVHGLLSGYTEDGGSSGEVALMSDILVTAVGSYHHAED